MPVRGFENIIGTADIDRIAKAGIFFGHGGQDGGCVNDAVDGVSSDDGFDSGKVRDVVFHGHDGSVIAQVVQPAGRQATVQRNHGFAPLQQFANDTGPDQARSTGYQCGHVFLPPSTAYCRNTRPARMPVQVPWSYSTAPLTMT